MVNEDYDLELEKLASKIKENDAKKILVQLGEGLKPRAKEIQEYLAKHAPSCEVHFWLNSCYGKCDIPEIIDSKNNDYDMLVQFGH